MTQKTALIADDDRALAAALALRCEKLGLATITCSNGLSAYETIIKQPPDLLILDENMPGANGLYLFEELSREQNLAPIPAIILTGRSDEATVDRCKNLGVHYVWKGLDTWGELEPVIRTLLDADDSAEACDTTAPERSPAEVVLEAVNPSTPKVLVVDDDPGITQAISVRLRPYQVEVICAHSGMQGYWTALKECPDVIIMDFRMPEGYGNVLLGKLQSHTLTKGIPVIVLTGQHVGLDKDYALERDLIRLGAKAFLSKPLDSAILIQELHRHIRLAKRETPTEIPVHSAP